MSSLDIVLVVILAEFGLAIAAPALARKRAGTSFVYAAACALSLSSTGAAIAAIVAAESGAAPAQSVLPLGIPWLLTHFKLDAISAFFLFVVGFGGATASLFAVGYGRHEREPGRVLPLYPAYLASMSLVVVADDAFVFLFAWELMSIASWLLVLANHRDEGNAHAAYVYVVMAGFGTLALLLAFGLLAGSDGLYDFAGMRGLERERWAAILILVLALIGAGSKAGLVPLHVWLPLAHPAAPSHVSALMSGVMTKVAVYGFVRIVFDLVGGIEWWWGALVLAIGGLTAVHGVLSALMQKDLKRLLAFHTVENIGIIFIGLGLALAFRASRFADTAAALAFAAALFHVFNHSAFKSLLFFGAGAVLTATGERDMERQGGLIHRMPATALAFLIGAAAISALPPLNGFVSEWLILQSVLLSPTLDQWGLKFLVPAVGLLLALSAALAAACFVKAFGITFLGRARSIAAARAIETDGASLAAMYVLVAACVIAGVVPMLMIELIEPAARLAIPGSTGLASVSNYLWLAIPAGSNDGSYSGLVLLVAIAAIAAFTVLAIHRLASRATRRAPAWDCGFPDPDPATQYSSASFAQPIRRVFGAIAFRAREHVEMPPPNDLRPARIEVQLRDLAWDWLYVPAAKAVTRAADRMNVVQFLSIRRYLSFTFSAVVVLLVAIALWR